MATVGKYGGAVAVDGLKETLKELEALGATKLDLVDLNYKAAQTVAQAAEPLVPVYTGTRNRRTQKKYVYKTPGSLKRSIRISKTKGYAQITMGNARVPYANPIHWGWGYDKNNFVEKHIKPSLFLTKALDANYGRIIEQYDKGIEALFAKYRIGVKR